MTWLIVTHTCSIILKLCRISSTLIKYLKWFQSPNETKSQTFWFSVSCLTSTLSTLKFFFLKSYCTCHNSLHFCRWEHQTPLYHRHHTAGIFADPTWFQIRATWLRCRKKKDYHKPYPFNHQDLISNSPNCLPYSSYDVNLENLVLDQLMIP